MSDKAKVLLMLAGLVLAGPLLVVTVVFAGALFRHWVGLTDEAAILLQFLLVGGTLFLVGNAIIFLRRQWQAPMVVYDKPERLARMVDGQLLPMPLFPNLTSYHGPIDRSTQAPALLPSIEAAPALPHAEPFHRIVRELRPDHLILGYNLAGPVVGTLDDLLSTAIIGRPGTGKTTALRFILASVLAIGGDAMLLDPHGAIADDVAQLLAVAEDAAGMHRIAARIEQHLDRRLDLRRAGHPVGTPILEIADEWPLVSQMSEYARQVTARVILEGRKCRMYALISAQGLPSDHLGGSYIRDALSSRYIFNVTSLQARMAGLEMSTENKELLGQLATAGAGYSIFASAKRNADLFAISDTSVDDLRTLLGWLPPLPPNPSRSRAEESTPEAPKTPLLSASEIAKHEMLSWYAQGFTKPHVIARKMGKASSYADDVRQVLQEEGLI